MGQREKETNKNKDGGKNILRYRERERAKERNTIFLESFPFVDHRGKQDKEKVRVRTLKRERDGDINLVSDRDSRNAG